MKRIFSLILVLGLIASLCSVSVLAVEYNTTENGEIPFEMMDLTNSTYIDYMNGASSEKGIGISSRYFKTTTNSCYLNVCEVDTNGTQGTVTFTVKNKENGEIIKDANGLPMVYSFTSDSKGSLASADVKQLVFSTPTPFYFEISTSNPTSTRCYGHYVVTEGPLEEIADTETQSIDFADISGHWAENIIIKWKEKGIISGYPDGTFKPDNTVTRAELSKILASAFDLPDNEIASYIDVSENDWFYTYLKKADKYIPIYSLPTLYESNIPYSDNQGKNNFLPGINAIRMHVAEALVEIKLSEENIVIDDLTIQEINAQVQEVFKDAEYTNLMAISGTGIPQNVQRMNRYTWLAYKLDIMKGDTEGCFNPYGYMTRAELLTAIDRLLTTSIEDTEVEKEWENSFVYSNFNDNSIHYQKSENGEEVFDRNSGIKYVSGVATQNSDGEYILDGENLNHLSWVKIGYDEYYGGLYLGISMIAHHLIADDEFSGMCSNVVTNLYDGSEVKDNADLANEYFSISINGKPITIKAVGMGKGNGHHDYYFALDTDISRNDIKEVTFEGKI